MNNEKYLKVINDYLFKLNCSIDNLPFTPRQTDNLYQLVVTRWAAEMIFELIKQNPSKSPIDIVVDFATKMDKQSTNCEFTSLTYSIANDAAIDIYDQFYLTKGE